MIVPLGGILMIAGWMTFAVQAFSASGVIHGPETARLRREISCQDFAADPRDAEHRLLFRILASPQGPA